ncbi:MAG TPA: lipocalin-like domain-containing protein [Vicinamibacteria bacterium]|jgi:predicted secreted hydrolase|nr:lipocalin-like domain-containing protein [Vicinamibacteria bacterium]
MRRALLATLAVVGLGGLWAWVWRAPARESRAPSIRMAPDPAPVTFERAIRPRPFLLPQDHGPHYDYQTEWWYYTGNLRTEDGRPFGYQLTFFRRGLLPGAPPPGPGLATNQLYLAHLAVTDVTAATHVFRERFSRGAAGLAGAAGAPFEVWLEDWRAEAVDATGSDVHLRARDAGLALDLDLKAAKPLITYGDRGLSPKGEEPGNASYYVGYPRLHTRGTIGSGGAPADVEGESWFDHEWSTSALGPQAVGWDWFSLQLSDGREVMLFSIRRQDGTLEPVSGGTLVDPEGRTRHLGAGDFQVEVKSRWQSPESRAVYPLRWDVTIPSTGMRLRVEPWLEDQEMRTSFTYWEGAVRVTGSQGGAPLTGHGYAELTGYARSMRVLF